MTKKEAEGLCKFCQIWRASLVQLGERFFHRPRLGSSSGVAVCSAYCTVPSLSITACAHAAQADEVVKQHTVILGRRLV